MKKVKIWSALAVLALSSSIAVATAHEGPYRRTCRLSGGQPWVVQLSSDDLELCLFGEAAISSETLYRYTEARESALAASRFLGGATSCSAAQGSVLGAVDSDQKIFSLCRFVDGSVIETGTLESGPDSSKNAALAAQLLKN